MHDSFPDLMQRLRSGDSDAAWELVELYEPQVRRAVRVRMQDAQLRKVVDSVDICQSVFANFFVRAATGEYELEQPRELIALLVTMARNRVNDWYRKEKGRNRDRPASLPLPATMHLADAGPLPSQRVQADDLLAEVRERLTEDERRIAYARGAGRSWAEIAQEEHASPNGLRMRLRRALDRVTQELGLDELHTLP